MQARSIKRLEEIAQKARYPSSDMFESYDLPAETKKIQLVSLGCTSGAKVSFKKVGRAPEGMPFDWVLTTMDGLMNFITNDFLGFYDFGGNAEMPVPGSSKSIPVYQSSMHVVRQDDPTSQPTLGYVTAIERFQKVSAKENAVLFVRVAASSEEIRCAGLLLQSLQEIFGLYACLLLIIDDQGSSACGPCTIQTEPNLLIDYANTEKLGAAYVSSIVSGLKWAAHLPIKACEADNLAHVFKFRSRDTDWGLYSSDGRPLFLQITEGLQSIKNTMGLAAPGGPAAPATGGPVKSSAVLESEPVKSVEPDPELEAIPLVSLGTSPNVKRSLREIGRGAEAFPFDWTNTTLEGVMHFLMRDFRNFFQHTSCVQMNGINSAFRSPLHSFWLDDISNAQVAAGYRQRIENLKAFDAKEGPMMFVREAASGEEVRQAGKLLQILNGSFGMWATILLIVDNQGADAPGNIQVDSERGLMIHFCDTKGQGGEAPYADIIYQVLSWTAGRAMSASKVPTLADAYAYVKAMETGQYVGSSRAFDNDLAGEEGDHVIMNAFLKDGDAYDSEIMDQMQASLAIEFNNDPEAEHIQLVSLGCSCAPKMSFKSMGRGSETLPFDWMRTTLQGVYSFITNDFQGFYDFKTRMDVHLDDAPDMVMFRGQEHSFWHDDPRTDGMHEKYERRIKRFKELDASDLGILFVRGAATTDEVADAGTVARELSNRVGQHATLLMIFDFQGPTAKGAVTVNSEPNLMLYFNDTKVCKPSAPHCEAVRTALDWVVGRRVLATPVASVADALSFVHVTSHYGLKGTSGIPAFESVLSDPRLSEVTKEEVFAPSSQSPSSQSPVKIGARTEDVSPGARTEDAGHGGKLPRMNIGGATKKVSEPAPEPPAEPDRRVRQPQLPDSIKGKATTAMGKSPAKEPTANRIAVNVSPVSKGADSSPHSFELPQQARRVAQPAGTAAARNASVTISSQPTHGGVPQTGPAKIIGSAPQVRSKAAVIPDPGNPFQNGAPQVQTGNIQTGPAKMIAPQVRSTAYGPQAVDRAASPPPAAYRQSVAAPSAASMPADMLANSLRPASRPVPTSYGIPAGTLQPTDFSGTYLDSSSGGRVTLTQSGSKGQCVAETTGRYYSYHVVGDTATIEGRDVKGQFVSSAPRVVLWSNGLTYEEVGMPAVPPPSNSIYPGPAPTSYGPPRGVFVTRGSPERSPSFDVQIVPEKTVSELLNSGQRRAPPPPSSGSYVAPMMDMLRMGPVPQVSTMPNSQQFVPQVSSIQAIAQIGRVPQVRTLEALPYGQAPQVNTRDAQAQIGRMPFAGGAPQVSTREAQALIGRTPFAGGAPQVSTIEAQAQIGRLPMGSVPQVSTREAQAQIGRSQQMMAMGLGMPGMPTQAQMGRVPQVSTMPSQMNPPRNISLESSWTPIPTRGPMGSVPQVNVLPGRVDPLQMTQSALDVSSRGNPALVGPYALPKFSPPVGNISASVPNVNPYGMGSGIMREQGWTPASVGSFMSVNMGRAPQVSTTPSAIDSPFVRSTSMSREPLKPGMRAAITGVDDANQSLKVNGKVCTLVSFDPAKNKWIIRLPEGTTARVPTPALTPVD
jgi:hypothetical protein